MLKGEFISVCEDKSVFTVYKTFKLFERPQRAILKATAAGLYFAEVNGKRVGENYLAPGWTSYKKTLQVQQYDVTELLRDGENTVAFTVGEGWYKGDLTWERKRRMYGEDAAVCADLVADDAVVLSTDGSFNARESVIRESGIYDGEVIDFTAPLRDLTVKIIDYNKAALVEQICEPVRVTERLPVKQIIRTPEGDLVYDFGQNVAGVVEVNTPDGFDGRIKLEFCEILVHGNFYNANLRTAKATDEICIKGKATVRPEFTFHGFRYVRISGAELPSDCVTALVMHTDMRRTGSIHSSNKRFDRLMQNVVWGQRGNFVDIPTDCPQRDERLGWTGDINALCRTAAYNYDIRAFMKKWLNDLRNDQGENGGIPHMIPDFYRCNQLNSDCRHTDAMWSDCVTMVPRTLYEMYGDISFIADNYAAMKKFIAAREQTTENGLVCRGTEYGDWLALDNEQMVACDCIGRTDKYYITNVFFVNSLRIVAESARLLGKTAEAELYAKKYGKTLKLVRDEYFTKNGRLALDTVTAQVIALHFGIVEENHRNKLAKQLNDNVVRHGYRMVTGFVGSPYLLFALADNGYFDTAVRVLMNNGYPSWLYEVDMGATTVWERWNSLMPDGTPNPDGMNSYNHYAYGSVMEFVYRRIAGIETVGAGFKKVRIAPRPIKGLPALEAEYNGIKVGYKYIDGDVKYAVTVPSGIYAEIVINGKTVATGSGEYNFSTQSENLDIPPYTPESTVIEVFDNPKAVEAFNEVFGGIFTGSEIAWMKAEPKTLGFMAEFRDSEGKMKLSDFPEMLDRANKLFAQKTEL